MLVDIETYRKNLSDLANLREQVASLSLLKQDTLMLHQTIKLKDNAFRTLMEQVNFNKAVVDTLSKIKDQQAAIIANQDKELRQKDVTIEQLNKRKVSVFRQVMQIFAGVGVGVLIGVFK